MIKTTESGANNRLRFLAPIIKDNIDNIRIVITYTFIDLYVKNSRIGWIYLLNGDTINLVTGWGIKQDIDYNIYDFKPDDLLKEIDKTVKEHYNKLMKDYYKLKQEQAQNTNNMELLWR